jgi:hypothetical protein
MHSHDDEMRRFQEKDLAIAKITLFSFVLIQIFILENALNLNLPEFTDLTESVLLEDHHLASYFLLSMPEVIFVTFLLHKLFEIFAVLLNEEEMRICLEVTVLKFAEFVDGVQETELKERLKNSNILVH